MTGNVDHDKILAKTLQVQRRSDPSVTGIIVKAPVVWIGVWKPAKNATKKEMRAGKGEWVQPLEGPVFMFSRSTQPFYQMTVKPRSQGHKGLSFQITDKFVFVDKKPSLQFAEADDQEIYNFYFPTTEEGSASYDRILNAITEIKEGRAHTLTPLIQLPTQESQRLAEPVLKDMNAVDTNRTLSISELFAALPPPPVSQQRETAAPEQSPQGPQTQTTPVPIPSSASRNQQARATDLIARLTSQGPRATSAQATGTFFASPSSPPKMGVTPTTPVSSLHGTPKLLVPTPPPLESPPDAPSSIMASLFGIDMDKGNSSTAKANARKSKTNFRVSHDDSQDQVRPCPSKAVPSQLRTPQMSAVSGWHSVSKQQPSASDADFSTLEEVKQDQPKASTASHICDAPHKSQGNIHVDAQAKEYTVRAFLDNLMQDNRFVDAVFDALSAVRNNPDTLVSKNGA